ncbi:hypothetical protein [Micromonospora sp. 067-2]|uniref:hypothetical protein n=1 Tax=Micromonospora sp. 067-2 TaxID=2789270 RepID=UPI00397E6620
MPDLLWDDVKWFFDPGVMGSLPDVCVPGVSLEDCQSVPASRKAEQGLGVVLALGDLLVVAGP